ncbi:MAG: hypothetical protein AB2559_10300 [Candidatus Thiodiazotropha endolucinida]
MNTKKVRRMHAEVAMIFRLRNVRLGYNLSIIPEKTVFLFHNKHLDWKNNHMKKGKFDAQEE